MSFRFSWLPECFKPGILFLSNCTSRGTQHFTGTVSNEATSEMGYPVWPTGRTCSRHSNRLSSEPARRFIWFFMYGYRNLQFILVFAPIYSALSQNWDSHWLIQVTDKSVFWKLVSHPYGGHELLPHEYWASVDESLLPLNSRRVRFLFWGRCHDRCIPQQNSRSCFSSSVWLMSSRQDDMSPMREPCGKELSLQPTLNLHFYS